MARKGQPSYNLYICRTNFIFFGQLLFLLDKLYIFPGKTNILCTNFIFLSQTLYFPHNLYISHTNFIFLAQTLYFPHKLYISRTNFILVVQTLFYISRTNFILHFAYKLKIERQTLHTPANFIFFIQTLYRRANFIFFHTNLYRKANFKSTCKLYICRTNFIFLAMN